MSATNVTLYRLVTLSDKITAIAFVSIVDFQLSDGL